jgi:uncharacterized membrane protein YeaQ/YmgE (transglycosylase-associated protein family)
MIGMGFWPFLALLIVGVIASFVLHYVVRYRMLTGFDGFLGKWIVGWVGAWLGSPVLGHWGPHITDQYIIPALIGSFSLVFLATIVMRASMAVQVQASKREVAAQPVQQFEMKKAS